MGMPKDVGAVDLMIAFPHADASVDDYTFRSLLRDEGSADMVFPVEYIFKDVPNHLEEGKRPHRGHPGRDGQGRCRHRSARRAGRALEASPHGASRSVPAQHSCGPE